MTENAEKTENAKMPNFNSEYEKKLYIKYKNAGYSEDSIAKMIEICVKDKALFDSGKINTEEGKLLHKYYSVEKAKIIEAEMTPEEEAFHTLKEIVRVKRKLDKAIDEKERKALEQEDKELVMYMSAIVLDIDNNEFMDALGDAIEKISDKNANQIEVSEAIRNVRSKIKGKRANKEVDMTKAIKTRDTEDNNKSADLTKEQKENEAKERKLAGSMARVCDKLSKKADDNRDVGDKKNNDRESVRSVGKVSSSRFEARNKVR